MNTNNPNTASQATAAKTTNTTKNNKKNTKKQTKNENVQPNNQENNLNNNTQNDTDSKKKIITPQLSSDVYSYFQILPNKKYKCIVTNTKCIEPVAKGDGTYNLLRHLERHHEDIHKVVKAAINSKNKKKQNDPKQPSMQKFLGSVNESRITFQIINFIIQNIKPLSMIENEGFMGIIKLFAPKYTAPDRLTLRTKILKLAESGKNKIIDKIQKYQQGGYKPALNITYDHTTTNQTQYLSMSVSYLDDEMNPQNYQLEISIVSSEKSENITQDLRNVLKKYLIIYNGNDDYEIFVIADGAACNKKSSRESEDISTQIVCFAHIIHNSLKAAFKVNRNETVETEGGKKETKEGDIEAIINKAQSNSRYFRHSQKRMNALKSGSKDIFQKFKKPKLANATRWNSVYVMLNSILQLQENFEGLWKNPSEFDLEQEILEFMLSKQEFSLIEKIVQILHPFLEVTINLQCRDHSPISHILPNYQYLVSICQEEQQYPTLTNENQNIIVSFKKQIIIELESRFNNHYKDVEHILYVATFMDPQFREIITMEKENMTYVIDEITSYAEYLVKDNTSDNADDKKMEIEDEKKIKMEEEEQNDNGNNFKNFMQQIKKSQADKEQQIKMEKQQNSIAETMEDEIRQYLLLDYEDYSKKYKTVSKSVSEQEISFQFWKKYQKQLPILFNIARNYLGISSTSAEQERAFSLLSLIKNDLRSVMNADIINALMFLKLNIDNGTFTEQQLYDMYQDKGDGKNNDKKQEKPKSDDQAK